MLNIISCILFSISANFDNIVLGISFGLKKVHISVIKNFIISLFTTVITVAVMKFSKILFVFFKVQTIDIIGSISLICIGFIGIVMWIYSKYICKKNIFLDNKRENKDKDGDKYNNNIKSLGIKDLITLIFTLSLNNIATGIAGSATGLNIFFSFISNFLVSFLFLFIRK